LDPAHAALGRPCSCNGVPCDASLAALIAYSVAAQLAGMPVFVLVTKRTARRRIPRGEDAGSGHQGSWPVVSFFSYKETALLTTDRRPTSLDDELLAAPEAIPTRAMSPERCPGYSPLSRILAEEPPR